MTLKTAQSRFKDAKAKLDLIDLVLKPNADEEKVIRTIESKLPTESKFADQRHTAIWRKRPCFRRNEGWTWLGSFRSCWPCS